jgi:O-antigen ligase
MKALRVGLCLLLAFSVLSFGAVQVWSQSILEIGAALLLLIWAFLVFRNSDGTVHWSPLNWPLLGFIAIGLFQLLFRQTAYPFLTRTDLLKLCVYFLFFFLTAQAFRGKEQLSLLVWFVVLFCFAISLLGIIQHFTSEQEIYWLPSIHVRGDPFGPYVNRNHFAGFIELTLPTGLALMVFRGVRRDQFALVGLLTIVPVSAMILAGSRGGIVSFALEILVLAVLAIRRRATGGARLAAVGLVAVAACALVAWVGAQSAIQRFSALQSQDPSLARRISMSRGALHIFRDHPIEGAGLGTLVSVYPLYETVYDNKLVDHVHNDFTELLAEEGLLGGLCGLSFLWLLYREARANFEARQSHFSRAVHAGSIVALSGLLLHSLVDFNLHIPSNALLFLLQTYLAVSVPLPSEVPSRPRSRSVRVPSVVA